MSGMPWDQPVWIFNFHKKHCVCRQTACSVELPGLNFCATRTHRCAMESTLCSVTVEQSLPAISRFPMSPHLTLQMLTASAPMLISTGITFRHALIIIWWPSRERLLTGTPSYFAAQDPATEHSSAGNDWENSKFKWGRGDGVKQMCCCSPESSMHTGWARTSAHRRAWIYIHVHRQQCHSIILVEGQSISCWLTGIQSPFPTGPEWKNGRRPVKKPTLSHRRLMG